MEATESTPISGDVGPPDAAWWGRRAWALLVGVRARAPLVQCITNFVSMDISANALLAAGASPAMVHGLREVADFTPHCDAVYVNVGTLSEDWVPAMRAAAAAAAAAGRPWVLDPVAAAASGFRMDACLGLVGLRPAVVRGNASEILALNSASASRSGGSKFQSQPAQLQQQLGVQQQPSMQQRLQASAGMLQQQNNIDQQKQFIQAQRGLQQVSSSSHAGAGDWQEEIYQKIENLKDLYFAELSDFYNKISLKLQQLDTIISASKPSEQYEKMKNFKVMVERTLQFLQFNKNNIQPSLRDKIPTYEKQIINILNSQKRKPMQPQGQQQFQQSAGHGPTIAQQQPSQGLQQHDNHTNQMQQVNLQGMTNGMQTASAAGIQHVPVPSSTNFGVPTTQQNVTNAAQAGSNLEPAQGSNFSSLQQGAMGGSLQQGGALQLKTGTPLQSANSPFVPSLSPPIAPSPIPVDSEKPLSNISSLSNAGQIGHQQASLAPQTQSIAVATPGISASPLLPEFTSADGSQANIPTQVPGKSSTAERPLDRLLKAASNFPTNSLCTAVFANCICIGLFI